MIGRRPDSTLGTRKIVIGMLTADTMNKHIVRHFKLLSLRYPVLEPRSVRLAVSKIENHANRSRQATRREDIDKVTSFRCNQFLSRERRLGLGRNVLGTRICAKTVQRRLQGGVCADVANTLVFR